MTANRLAWILNVPVIERQARLRELRVAALFLLGPKHAASLAISAAIDDPGLAGEALTAVDALPALQRRRVLAVIGAVL